VIKIRYADLPSGLHIRAVRRGRATLIYLLPGLTVAERRAALARAKASGRIGQGPELSTLGLGLALAVNGIRTTLRNGASAIKTHPAIFLPPMVIVASAVIAYVLLVSVGVEVRGPVVIAGGPQVGPVIAAGTGPVAGAKQTRRPAGGSSQPGSGPSAAPGGGTTQPSGGTGTGGTGKGKQSPGPTPTGRTTGPAGPSPAPAPSARSSSPSASPSPSGSTSSSAICVTVGPLGICLP
jgi:hypothetical protein